MKVYRLAAAGRALGLLTGCASLLERSYTTSEPHSSKFWESEAAATLRAENRQDMVNDLRTVIAQHTETASLRLYNFQDDQSEMQEFEKPAQELQQQRYQQLQNQLLRFLLLQLQCQYLLQFQPEKFCYRKMRKK